MAIESIAGDEVRRGSCSIWHVFITDNGLPEPRRTAEGRYAWEFQCMACDAFSTNLTEDEARAELAEHVCPDVPPCEGDDVIMDQITTGGQW